MKTTLKLGTLLVALASVFTFTSCLNSNDSSDYPTYSSYVTITGDEFFGYTFHTDFGAKLIPTSSSVTQVLPGLSGSDVKRAFVAFDLASETENGKTLEAGHTYDIVLCQSNYANYAIPTFNTIPYTAGADSLINNNERIITANQDIWAINGYVNAQMTLSFDQYKAFDMKAFYKEEDIDVANNQLTLNVYYNSKSSNHTGQAQSVISFKLPEELAYKFHADTISLTMKGITGYDNNTLSELGTCKLAVKDFYIPMN